MPVAAILATLGLAGCVEGAGGTGTGQESSSGEFGAVAGLVISDELFPVPGAKVEMEGFPIVSTNDGGRFEIGGVAPGTYLVRVNATGYKPHEQKVELFAPERIELVIPLVGVPGLAPYKETIPFEGFSVCSFSAVYSAGWPSVNPVGPVPCALGTPKIRLVHQVGEHWRAGVHEMNWQGAEEMIFASSLEPNCVTSGSTSSKCPAMLWGLPPLRIQARPLDPDYAKRYAINGKEMWPEGAHTSHVFTGYSGYFRTQINQTFYNQCVIINRQFSVPEHWGCPFGVGFALGMRFQFYHTTFYHEEPLRLEDFSALPDR